MKRLVSHCSRVCPDEVWSRIQDLDFDAGYTEIQGWLETVLEQEPPDTHIVAFWFGLFDQIGANGQAFSSLYISGAETYQDGDDSGEWACSPKYFPAQRYAESEVLRVISGLLSGRGNSVISFGPYVLPLGFAALALRQAQRILPVDVWLRGCARRSIAVGFDSGDFVTLPEMRAEI